MLGVQLRVQLRGHWGLGLVQDHGLGLRCEEQGLLHGPLDVLWDRHASMSGTLSQESMQYGRHAIEGIL